MTADEIRQQAMARRTQQGLKMVVQTPDGPSILYPKDQATKTHWIAAARRKGWAILEQ